MDKRDLARANRWWQELDRNQMLARVSIVDEDWQQVEDGEWIEDSVWVPIRWEVCESCEGRGRYVNPNIDRHGLTSEDFYEQGDDFREGYFSGMFDVTCAECDGERVVPVYVGTNHDISQHIERIVAENYAYDQERESEMRYMYGPDY